MACVSRDGSFGPPDARDSGAFHLEARDPSVASAQVVVPVLREVLDPTSVRGAMREDRTAAAPGSPS